MKTANGDESPKADTRKFLPYQYELNKREVIFIFIVDLGKGTCGSDRPLDGSMMDGCGGGVGCLLTQSELSM